MNVLHVLFRVAEADYVVPAADVLYMESFTGATKVPGAPAYVAGIVQVRGHVVPVVDLRLRFGLPASERGLDARVVVVRVEARTVGLLVDSAREVVQLPDEGFRAPPDVVSRQGHGFVKAIAQRGSSLVMLIDLNEIIGQESPHGS
jgi:purine-binding chemotaxis protein CheW